MKGLSRRSLLHSAAGAALAVASLGAASCAQLGFLGASAADRPFNGGVLTPAVQLPAFALQRADGGRFSALDTRGRLSLFFFGYTYCPDVCPMTLANVAAVRRLLGASAQKVDAYFVTVDPERDTPARLLVYVAHFDRAIVPLTGTPEELERARGVFGALAQKREVPESAAGYLMDHTAFVYLVDPESRIRLVFLPDMKTADIAADIRRLLPR